MIDLHVNDVSLGKLVIENIHRMSIFISLAKFNFRIFVNDLLVSQIN